MSKARFCLYIFGPIALGYILPLIFYGWPVKILTAAGTYEINTINLAMAIAACIIWFGIAILLIIYPRLLPLKKKADRYWTAEARWAGFLYFSLFGGFVAIFHRIFLMPGAIEQLVHQLSLMPTIGFILGLCCLRDLALKEPYTCKKIVVFILMGLDALIVLTFPIVLGWVWPVLIGTVGILFGMALIGVGPIKQTTVLGILAIVIFWAMIIKNDIRIQMCGGACERVAIQKVFYKDKIVKLEKKPYLPQTGKIPVTPEIRKSLETDKVELSKKSDSPQEGKLPSIPKFLRSLETDKVGLAKKPELPQEGKLPITSKILRSWESQKKVLKSGFDPNYESLRFIPSQLENSIFHFFIARVLHRINYIGQLGYIIQTTGDKISYSYGKTYYPLPTKFIPRAIWPGKPEENMGQYFGHRYKFIQDEDLTTSVNLPLIVEGYMNWGWFGIVFSAMFVGIVLRFLLELWIGESGATGNVILGMVVVMNMVLQEVNLSLVFGGLLYGGLVYWSLEALFRYWFNSRAVVNLTTSPSITKV